MAASKRALPAAGKTRIARRPMYRNCGGAAIEGRSRWKAWAIARATTTKRKRWASAPKARNNGHQIRHSRESGNPFFRVQLKMGPRFRGDDRPNLNLNRSY